MKRIAAIVRPEKLVELKAALDGVGVRGMTVYEVMGCGSQRGWSEYVRGNEVMLSMIPKVKLELVAPDEQVDDLIDLVCDTALTGEVGDGKIFVTAVEECVRIRTRERGEAAL